MAVALTPVGETMGRLAAAVAAGVIGATIGVAIVVLFGNGRVQRQVSIPASLATTVPSEAAESSDGAGEPLPSEASDEKVPEPVRVVIPAIDVDAELVPLGLNDDGSMEVPNFGLAGWYEPGPWPGAPGPAVIAAHVDSVNGPDVFYRLKELERGDKIIVERKDGSKVTYRARKSEQQLKEDLPVDRIWNDTDKPVLRLITCGGNFDREERSYKSNVIVYASST